MFQKIIDLINITGEIEGRKKIHKIIYILKSEGFNFEEDFDYHYFGPYSKDIQLKIEYLLENKFIFECHDAKTNTYFYKPSIEITTSKNNFFAECKDIILFLRQQSDQCLEILATWYFLKNKGYQLATIENKITTLKPNLVDKVKSSLKHLEQINKLKPQINFFISNN